MSAREAVEVTHRGFRLIGNAFDDPNTLNSCYRVYAYKELSKGATEAFNERVCFTHEYIRFVLQTRDEFPFLRDKTFSRAMARIDLGLYKNGQSYAEVILTTTPSPEPKADHVVERYILVALDRLRRLYPQQFRTEPIDVDGFCDLVGTTRDQYHYNAELLAERGYLKEAAKNQFTIKNGGIYITAEGIDHLGLIKKMGAGNFEMKGTEESKGSFDFDIVISYASEDGQLVQEVAKQLRALGFKVFFDQFEEAKLALWGTNMFDFLADIYSKRGRFCMIFISEHYTKKAWTTHERQQAQARAMREKEPYILPVKIDDTELTGMPSTINYFDLRKRSTQELVSMASKKLTQS